MSMRVRFAKNYYPGSGDLVLDDRMRRERVLVSRTQRAHSTKYCVVCGRPIDPATVRYVEIALSVDHLHIECGEVVEG